MWHASADQPAPWRCADAGKHFVRHDETALFIAAIDDMIQMLRSKSAGFDSSSRRGCGTGHQAVAHYFPNTVLAHARHSRMQHSTMIPFHHDLSLQNVRMAALLSATKARQLFGVP
jgi:hypothetical protein